MNCYGGGCRKLVIGQLCWYLPAKTVKNHEDSEKKSRYRARDYNRLSPEHKIVPLLSYLPTVMVVWTPFFFHMRRYQGRISNERPNILRHLIDYLSCSKPMLGQYLIIGQDSFYDILPDISDIYPNWYCIFYA
jgi:hypothetical protein